MDIFVSDAEEFLGQQKSVIGRGIAGGLLLGPAAAVVGALSALNKGNMEKISILEISFYDPSEKLLKHVYVRSKRGVTALFAQATQKEIAELRPQYNDTFLERSLKMIEELSPKQAAKIREDLVKQGKLNGQ